MPREIKGWKHRCFIRNDAWEAMKAEKLYYGLYAEKDVKVHRLHNQFGIPYINIYIRKYAKPIRTLEAQFGSAMTFKDRKTGQLSGNKISIQKRK